MPTASARERTSKPTAAAAVSAPKAMRTGRTIASVSTRSTNSSHCGVAIAYAAKPSHVQRCHMTTAVAEAAATKSITIDEYEYMPSSTTGEASAPRIPSAAMPGAAQRTASAVAVAPTAIAAAIARIAGTRW
jgi:hypothetical protein